MDDSNLTKDLADAVRFNAQQCRAQAFLPDVGFSEKDANLLSAIVLDELAERIEHTGSFCAEMFLRMRETRI